MCQEQTSRMQNLFIDCWIDMLLREIKHLDGDHYNFGAQKKAGKNSEQNPLIQTLQPANTIFVLLMFRRERWIKTIRL